MGITGLLPFLDKSSRKVNISEFSGCTVGIDTYCWLHKGAFAGAEKIVMGHQTDVHVKYCLKFVNMLLSHKIKPILVFDGRHLPAKAETESKRRESREANRKRAAELIKMGKASEGKILLKRSLDVSHQMALDVIKVCQAQNVDCIVAPYEADAQLAYLNSAGIADIIITEDSDLTLFGCKKIIFKMDHNGFGVLVEQDKLHLAMGLNINNFSLDKFRYMCILSGCDYLASLPGIGLAKACKFIVRNTDDDIYNALPRLPSALNMKSLHVTSEYRVAFMKALITFKHQLVFCPLTRKQTRLSLPDSKVTEEQLECAGVQVNEDLAYQLALGNCDPFTFKILHNFNPDKPTFRRKNSWSESIISSHASIWSCDFKIEKKHTTPKKEKIQPPKANCQGKVVILKTERLKNDITPKKRCYEEDIPSTDELISIYGKPDVTTPPSESKLGNNIPESSDEEKSSPIIVRRSNPFRKKDVNEVSPIVTSVRRRLPVRRNTFKTTVIDETVVTHSEFFPPKKPLPIILPETPEEEDEDEQMEITDSMIPNYGDSEGFKENVNMSDNLLSDINIEESHKQIKNKESDLEKQINESISEREMDVSSNLPVQNSSSIINYSDETCVKNNSTLKEVDRGFMDIDDDTINCHISYNQFSEKQSDFFKFEYKAPEKKLKRDPTPTNITRAVTNRSTTFSQKNSGSRRSLTTKSTSKKSNIIPGQQNLLQMFGRSKPTSLKH